MGMGLVIASGATIATSTTESTNQVKATYDYIGPGSLKLFMLPSNAAVRVNLFVNGVQILRNEQVAFFGTTGGMDDSANLVTAVNTLGGRVELTFVATTGTPTVDFKLTHDGIPFGRTLSRLLGR